MNGRVVPPAGHEMMCPFSLPWPPGRDSPSTLVGSGWVKGAAGTTPVGGTLQGLLEVKPLGLSTLFERDYLLLDNERKKLVDLLERLFHLIDDAELAFEVKYWIDKLKY